MDIKQINEELNMLLNEEWISFKNKLTTYNHFKGTVNPKTGEIIYSILSPNYNRILSSDKRLNLSGDYAWYEKEIIEAAKQAIKDNHNSYQG